MITIQAGYAVVVDDEPANRDFVERLLQTASFKVVGASNGAEGLLAARNVPQLAIALVDQQLPDTTGLEVLKKLRAENPEAVLVMATMHDHRSLIDEAFSIGVDIFLVKPHGFMELYRRLKEADLDTSQLRGLIIDQYGPRAYKGPAPASPAPEAAKPEATTAAPKEEKPVVPVAPPAATQAPEVKPAEVIVKAEAPIKAETPAKIETPVKAEPTPAPVVNAEKDLSPHKRVTAQLTLPSTMTLKVPQLPIIPEPEPDKDATQKVVVDSVSAAPSAPAAPAVDKEKTLPRRPRGLDAAIKPGDNKKPDDKQS